MITLQPIADRIIVKQREAEKKGSIIMTEAAKKKPAIGEVLAIGPGITLENGQLVPIAVKVGDVVYYAAYSGTEIEKAGEKYLVLSEGDILAIDKP